MYNKTLFKFIASAAMLAAGLDAQQTTTPIYLSVACVKVAPGKGAEYRQFVRDTSKKIADVRVNAGEILSWGLSRSVMPAGDEARCDYLITTASEGVPANLTDTSKLSNALDKAGIKMSAAQYLAKRDSMSHLVSLELWRPRVRIGQLDKGSYYFVNHMKVHQSAEYIKFETEMWKPFAEELIKEGHQSGWRFNTLLLPSGSDIKYTAVSLDVYPNWNAVFARSRMQDAFKRVYPDKDYAQFMGGLSKLRDLSQRDLMYIEEMVTKK